MLVPNTLTGSISLTLTWRTSVPLSSRRLNQEEAELRRPHLAAPKLAAVRVYVFPTLHHVRLNSPRVR